MLVVHKYSVDEMNSMVNMFANSCVKAKGNRCPHCRTSQSLYCALYMYVVTFQERIESAVSWFSGISLGIDIP